MIRDSKALGWNRFWPRCTAMSFLDGDEAGDRKAAALVQETYNVLKGLNLKSGPNVLLPSKGHRTHPKTRYKAFG